jgi:hypothetical protein
MTYSKPGNPDLAVLREYIRRNDVNAAVDQDLMREREFTDYPFTVETYVVSIGDLDGLQRLKDVAYRYPEVKVILVPIQELRLRSFYRLDYTKPLLGAAVSKIFWIGDSPPVSASALGAAPSFEDPSLYGEFFKNCRSLTSACFQSLLDHGYFQRHTVIDSRYQAPADFLSAQLAESIRLRSSGLDGKYLILGKGALNLDYDKPAIKSMALINEVWISGEPLGGAPDREVLRLSTKEKRPIAAANDSGEFSFSLPVGVAGAALEDGVNGRDSDLLLLLQEFQNALNNQIGRMSPSS